MNLIARKFKSAICRVKSFYYSKNNLRKLAEMQYASVMGCKINWQNPSDINEKINWLKFFSNTEKWSELADKYLVRNFVTERIGDRYLVPLYGKWEDPNDIDYSSLPNQFVLKTNNGAGSVIIVKDKTLIDKSKVNRQLSKWMKEDFGRKHAEPHYSKIKPCILAEALLKDNNPDSKSIVDYKIWCFDGKVFGTWVCFNRELFHADTEWHDIDWNFRPEWSVFDSSYKNGGGKIERPRNYQEMLEIAAKLSKGFPEVRVDLYNIDGKIYFGEMTFSSAGGHMNFYSKEILDQMGRLTLIPK